MSRQHQVLLICSDPNLRRSFALILHNAGYSTNQTASLMAGYELLEKNKFDLVILGALETEVNPTEIIARIRPTHLSTKLLFLTETIPAPSITRSLQESGQRYLTQPFTPARFLHSVASLLDGRPRTDVGINTKNTLNF